MKILKNLFLFTFIACFALVSCKKQAEVNQLSLIPENASMVMEINGREILKKSGLDKPDDYKFMTMAKGVMGEFAPFVESLLKGSKEAGISIDNILFYSTELPNFCMNFQVKDKKALENWMKKSGMPEPKENNGIRYFSTMDVSLAWNDHLLVMAYNTTLENMSAYFDVKESGLLATSNDFKEFLKKSGDVKMWMQYGALLKSYEKMFGLKLIDGFDNVSMHGYLNFKDGEIEGTSSFYPAEAVTQLKEQYPIFKKGFDMLLLKDLPEQAYVGFNMSINIADYVKFARKNIEKILNSEQSKPYMDDYYSDMLADRYEQIEEILDSPEITTIINALTGDAVLSIHGFNQGIISYPLLSVNIAVKSEEAFKEVLALIPTDLYKLSEGYYTANLNKFIPVYFAYRDSKVLVTLDLNTIKEFSKGALPNKDLSQNPMGKLMADKMVFFMNLDYDSYPQSIKMLIQNYLGRRISALTSIIEIYENMYFTVDDNYNTEFHLNLKNKNVNSSKQILKSIDKIFGAWSF